jgi:hypothetical protein
MIDHTLPILIRLGQGFNKNHELTCEPHLIKETRWSNPCFMINKPFAKMFLKHLKKINHTSDIYIHQDLPNLESSIQAFTMNPTPIFELSTQMFEGKIFRSLIHPRTNHESDTKKYNDHISRKEFCPFLILSMPTSKSELVKFIKKTNLNIGYNCSKIDGIITWEMVPKMKELLASVKKTHFDHIVFLTYNPYIVLQLLFKSFRHDTSLYTRMRKDLMHYHKIELPETYDSNDLVETTERCMIIILLWCNLCRSITNKVYKYHHKTTDPTFDDFNVTVNPKILKAFDNIAQIYRHE